jgi:hypothetical protein
VPAPFAPVPLTERAPPAGAAESACAVKLAPAPAVPAPFVAVTEPLCVPAAFVKV